MFGVGVVTLRFGTELKLTLNASSAAAPAPLVVLQLGKLAGAEVDVFHRRKCSSIDRFGERRFGYVGATIIDRQTNEHEQDRNG